MLAFTLAIPLLAVIGWFGYQFLSASHERVSEASVAPALTRSNLNAALKKSGVEPRRISAEKDRLVVETPLEASELSTRLRKYLTNATVDQNGSDITIHDGARREMLRVVPVRTVNSDAGLIEAEEVADIPEESDRPRVAAAYRGERAIVLVIDDVGFAGQPIDDIASIDARLNAAVIPGTPHASQSAEKLADSGFEILCHLPMEPIDFPRMKPGDDAIMTSMSDDEIESMTLRDLASIPHARGFNNHMGSRATTDPRVMRAVLSVASKQGFFYLDSKTTPRSIGERIARRMGIPTAGRDVFLDDNVSERAVRRQLAELVKRSEKYGLAIGIGHPYPNTIRVLREEIPRLRAQGFKFLHVSEVVR